MNLVAIAIVSLGFTPSARLDLRLNDRWTTLATQSFVPANSEDLKEEEQRFTYQIKEQVTGVKRDEFDIEARSRLLKHRFGGEDLPPSKGAPDLVEKWRVQPSGFRNFEPARFADSVEFRLARLSWVGFPATASTLPMAWKVRWPGYAEWAPPAEVTLKRTGATIRLDRQCIRIQFQFTELEGRAPIRASGTLEIDEQTGILMALALTSDQAPIPGGTDLQRLTMSVEVTDLKLQRRD